MYLIDDDGEEYTVTEKNLRLIAKRNHIIDWDTMPVDELADCLMDCFENLTVTEVA